MWRSPVAQRSGGPEVASSNLVIPTKKKEPKGFFFCYISMYSCLQNQKNALSLQCEDDLHPQGFCSEGLKEEILTKTQKI